MMLLDEPIDAKLMADTGLTKDTKVAVCQCGCKKFKVLTDHQGRVHFYCLHCEEATNQLP